MKKTKENFDTYLDRLYEEQRSPFEDLGITGSKIIKYFDPISYEVGFSKWEPEEETENHQGGFHD